MPNRTLAIGRIVHYVTEDYEAPAMVVSTVKYVDEYFKDEFSRGSNAHLHVFLPMEEDGFAVVDLKKNVPHRGTPTAGTYHWADECPIQP